MTVGPVPHKALDYAAVRSSELLIDAAVSILKTAHLRFNGVGRPHPDASVEARLVALGDRTDRVIGQLLSIAGACVGVDRAILEYDYEGKGDPDCVSPEPTGQVKHVKHVDKSVILTGDNDLYGQTKKAWAGLGIKSGPSTPEEVQTWNFIYRNRSVAAGKGDPYYCEAHGEYHAD